MLPEGKVSKLLLADPVDSCKHDPEDSVQHSLFDPVDTCKHDPEDSVVISLPDPVDTCKHDPEDSSDPVDTCKHDPEDSGIRASTTQRIRGRQNRGHCSASRFLCCPKAR